MNLVLISDTHCLHEEVSLPPGDVLIHAGDMALRGNVREVQSCLDWLNAQPHEYVIAIAGNHDWAFQKSKSKLNLGRIHYLENSSVNINGKNFYGSPVQPWFCDWAFNVQRGPEIKKYWDMIPDAGLVDVLITHGPPAGVLDQSEFGKTDHLGCEDLLRQVKISQPLVHVFGHIHGGFGCWGDGATTFYNASQVNEGYQIANRPWVVQL